MVAFESLAGPLLFLHFVSAVVLAGSLGHLVWRITGIMRGRETHLSRMKLHTTLFAISYVVCYISGALLYPTFRVRVRHDYFDSGMPWATGLFEVKEHFATIGLAAMLGLVLLARLFSSTLDDNTRRIMPLFTGLVIFLLLVVGYDLWSGWFLNTLKGL